MTRNGQPLSQDDRKRRAPLWVALADLFLDTEMQVEHYAAVRQAALTGGFAAAEVKAILLGEVMPVFGFNAIDIAGEWAGFEPEWAAERVSDYLAGKVVAGKLPALALVLVRRSLLRYEWPRLARILAGEDIERAMAAEPPPLTASDSGLKRFLWWTVPILLAVLLFMIVKR